MKTGEREKDRERELGGRARMLRVPFCDKARLHLFSRKYFRSSNPINVTE